DMRLPIQYALTYPERLAGPARRLNWSELGAAKKGAAKGTVPLNLGGLCPFPTPFSPPGAWHFEQPDHETFPAVQLGYEVARPGGTCGAVLNAANEAAVSRFLAGELGFLDIPRVCRAVLENHHYSARPSLADLASLDRWARQEVNRWITAMPLTG